METVAGILEACREREKAQTSFYRRLAARAEKGGEEEIAERLNALHADEQHHLSRLTARLLELGKRPQELPPPAPDEVGLEAWEREAQEREENEVAWYRQVLTRELDFRTREVMTEILESERAHARELGGKWMSA